MATRKNVEESVADDYVEPKDPLPEQDIERLVPDENAVVTLANGREVKIAALRLREFLALLKIVTRGAAMALGSVRLDTNDEDFGQSMIAMFFFAIPEAEDEACDFVRIMVKPAEKFETREAEIAAAQELDAELENPELDDLFTVIETVINREGSDLRRLGKRLGKALEFARKTGQV